MTLTEAQEAGRMAAALQALRTKKGRVRETTQDADLGIDVTVVDTDGEHTGVGYPLLPVGKDLVLEVLDLLEQRLVSQLNDLGVMGS